MRRLLKWIGIVLGILIVILVVAVAGLYATASSRLNRTYDFEAEAITIPTDDDSLAHGAYLALNVCAECHGSNLGGRLFIDVPGIFTVYAANLTSGEGGIGDLTDADFIRAIRHGLNQDGTPLFIMPAEVFVNWSEEDLGATIAFLRTLPPVDNVVPELDIGVIGHVLFQMGMTGQNLPVEYIDHDQSFPAMPEIAVNDEYGAYLVHATGCHLCHGENMAGGLEPIQVPPGTYPPSPNLTGDNLVDWSEDDFVTALRGGERPDGSTIDGEFMSLDQYAYLTDVDLKAIWAYIQSLPAADSAKS